MVLGLRIRPRQPRRGSALPITMCIVLLASMSTIWMATTLTDHKRINRRKHDFNRAFHAAESGVRLVIHWSNDAESYALDPDLFHYTNEEVFFTENGYVTAKDGTLENQFPNLHAALQSGPLVITHDMLSQMNLGTLNARAGKWGQGQGDPTMATIEKIILTTPSAGDPNFPDGLTVYSVGVANSGIKRTVAAYLTLWPNLNIPLGAALVSMANAGLGGNAQVHWGESWARGNVTDLSAPNNGLEHLNESSIGLFDRWARYRAEGNLSGTGFALNRNSWATQWTTGMTAADMASKALYNGSGGDMQQPGWFPTGPQPSAPPLVHPDLPDAPNQQPDANPDDGNFTNAFFQNVPSGTLPFPDFLHQRRSQNDFKTYNILKKYAINTGQYYYCSGDGKIIGQDGNAVDFSQLQQSGSAEPRLFFVDTLDGNPPAADGSNLGNVKISGKSNGYHGLFYMCANVEIAGTGNPKYAPPVIKPDGSTDLNNSEYADLKRVFLNGAMFAAGSLKFSGNPVIYGTVISEKGIVSGGSLDIYYNVHYRNGLNLRGEDIPDRFSIMRQNNLAQIPGELANL